jgi:GDP-D-mannose dehydratase
MWKILQQEKADDFVLDRRGAHVREFLDEASGMSDWIGINM